MPSKTLMILLLSLFVGYGLSYNSSLHARQFDSNPSIQQIAVGLVAPIHVVQSPRSGKVLFLERINGGQEGTTHAAEFDFLTGKSRVLHLLTDTFCSAGFISPDSQGRVFNVGGWDGPALEAIRVFTPCGAPGVFGTCDWYENAAIASLKVPRWYPSALPLANGRVAIIGGTTSATGLPPPAPPALNQPNMEFLPPYAGEGLIQLQLLVETDTYNLYPIVHLLPNGLVFMLAGERSQLFDPVTFIPILELPIIPGKRTYPFAGGSVLLPLRPSNNYLAEVFVCGGGSAPEKLAPALGDCGRITPLAQKATWALEPMPSVRLMPDMTLLPGNKYHLKIDGSVLIINGAASGWGGFDNADEPIYTSVIYYPDLPAGQRFRIAATSNIARLYHSECLLLEDGRVLVSGSTPNADANAVGVNYPNEQRLEVFSPPYLTGGYPRPVYSIVDTDWDYNKGVNIVTTIPSGNLGMLKCVLHTNGFVTHSTHQGQRMVELEINSITTQSGSQYVVNILAPPRPEIIPPGWYMLFVVDSGIPSVATWVRVGGDPAGFENWV